jgi:hypothetical protein
MLATLENLGVVASFSRTSQGSPSAALVTSDAQLKIGE